MSIQGLWAGPFLIQFLGLPAVTAGNLLLMLSFGFVFGSPVSGLLSDRILKSRKKTLIPGFFIASLATFGLAQWQSPSLLPLLGGIFFVIGFFNGFAQVSYAHIRELMPEKMSGTAMSGVNFFTFMGGAVFIHGLGGVMERMTPDLSKGGEAYQTAFMLCSGALMAALLLYFTTKDTPEKNSEGVQYPPHG
jgi:MFS family permease